MEKKAKSININEFLFGRTRAAKKLEVINSMSNEEIRKTSESTILRIVKECKGNSDRFWIASDRRVGNNWNSTIEFVYEHNGHAWLCLYVQNSSTDSSTCVSYQVFNNVGNYEGYNENLRRHFTYEMRDKASVIRCILKEYIYWKYFEREEREKQEKAKKVFESGVYGIVVDYYYDRLAPRHICLDWKKENRKKYFDGKKLIEKYAYDHSDELIGKPKEELIAIFKKAFVGELV